MTSASTKRQSPEPIAFRRVVRALRVGDAKDAEIQRLRAAMVHAMDECERALALSPPMTKEQRLHARRASRLLREELEKK